MKNLNYLLKKVETDKEIQLTKWLYTELEGNFGELFSHVGVKEISRALNLTNSTVKGIVGSLVKKEVLDTWTNENNYQIISFLEQEELV